MDDCLTLKIDRSWSMTRIRFVPIHANGSTCDVRIFNSEQYTANLIGMMMRLLGPKTQSEYHIILLKKLEKVAMIYLQKLKSKELAIDLVLTYRSQD